MLMVCAGEATEKDQLRMRVSNLLMSSAENGELEKALAAVMKDGPATASWFWQQAP